MMTTTIKQFYDTIFDDRGMPRPLNTMLEEQLAEVLVQLKALEMPKETTIHEVTLIQDIWEAVNQLKNKEILK